MTRVWPALWPPWKRTTTSARCDSQSTILPLPSSPHWAPTTATFAIFERYSSAAIDGDDVLALEPVPAIEPPRLGRRVLHRDEPGHRRPAFAAQPLGRRDVAARRHIEPRHRLRRRHGAQHRVRIKR